jgi:uncharacterized membrane protein YbaN (DUF454 family)
MEVILKKLFKGIYIILGIIFLGVGIIGIVLPVLPTTPFVLLASFCLAKGSDRINNRFKKTKIYREYILNFKENGLTKKQKIRIVLTADLMLLASGYFVNNFHVRIFLFCLALIKTAVIFRIKTNAGEPA